VSWVGERFGAVGLRELLLGVGHLSALWAFAFAQPLLDLLGRSPEFFVARQNTGGDIVLFALALTIVPPLLMLVAEALATLVDRRAYRALHLALVALLVAAIALQLEKRVVSSPATVMIALAIAAGVGVAYLLWRGGFVRQLLNVLVIAPLVFMAIFLFFSATSELVLPQDEAEALETDAGRGTPVVLVVFDELPTATLMDRSGAIDSRRFPNFGRLASSSTWYPNNTTPADFTPRAVPAIYTGIEPGYERLPIASDHPKSIFTLLGSTYHLNSVEAVTSVCPEPLCGEVPRASRLSRLASLAEDLRYVSGRLLLPPALANDLPNVSTTFGDFGNNADEGTLDEFARDLFQPFATDDYFRWLSRIGSGQRPTLHQIHLELPHEPFRYLPDGRRYNETDISNLANSNATKWAVGPPGIATVVQRHYLQTAYADRLVGRLLDRLRKTGIRDRALVVVTADHGISFLPGEKRRVTVPANLGGVANPPLFIKYPRQRRGKVSRVHTETVDLVPTIADVLGVEVPYETTGKPISEARVGGPVVVQSASRQTVSIPWSTFLGQRRKVVGRHLNWLGEGGLWSLGPRPDLLGNPVPPPSAGGDSGGSVTVGVADEEEAFDPGANPLPVFVEGELSGVDPDDVIAIAANGNVAATCRAFRFEGQLRYGVVLPPFSLRRGENRFGIYRVGPASTLEPLGGN
jgi:Sulfatase